MSKFKNNTKAGEEILSDTTLIRVLETLTLFIRIFLEENMKKIHNEAKQEAISKETERVKIEGQIRSLIAELSASTSQIGDWKIIKCYEAKLLDKEMPYNLEELLIARQSVRDSINDLQEQLENLK